MKKDVTNQQRKRTWKAWWARLGVLGVLLSGSSSALACWTCADLPYLDEIVQSLTQIQASIGGGISDPLEGNVNSNLMDIKTALDAINKSVGTQTQAAATIKDSKNADAITMERSANVKAAALNYAPTVQGCKSATAAAGMAKSGAISQNSKANYQASAAAALIRAPRPASSDMQAHIAQSQPFCTPQQIADEAAAGVPSSQRQCPASPVAGALPAASLLSGSISGAMINPSAQQGGNGVVRKANDSIGSTVQSSPNGTIDSATAINQALAANAFIMNIQGPALPNAYDPQAIDTPEGKARKTYWDAFAARMSAVQDALSSISSMRSVITPSANGALTPPAPDPIWASNRADWQLLFPASSFPDTPSEWERLKFEVYRQQAAPGTPAPVHDLASMEALQMKISLLEVERLEDNNKLLSALLAQSLVPITKHDLDALEQQVARGRYKAPQ